MSMKHGLPPSGKDIDGGCSSTGCWEYSDLKGRKCQVDGENYMI